MFISGPGFTFWVGLLSLGFEVSLLYIYIFILLYIQCRGTWHTIRDHFQRSYLIVWDTEPDQLCVPASIFHCLWPPAKPRTGKSFSFHNCTVVAIWKCHRFLEIWAAPELTELQARTKEKTSLRFPTPNLPNMPVSFSGLFVHVRCIPHQEFDKMFLSKCVTHAGSVKVVWALRGKPF